ncbi:DUF6286 domain-containing protein [Streptomyces sp. XM4193]|uniref:DUF6286 domain-containing protein n=1 Tax=Streptomyces sp. XM4193 TaxID=2929782 RepID=UPI001FF95FDF|nr:DUF6286 domain-containing protein [Streptomyces sp. XM4193]MCK1796010.1 DUF6286 domain-containing protein [Streptomyces sp. XM4193]
MGRAWTTRRRPVALLSFGLLLAAAAALSFVVLAVLDTGGHGVGDRLADRGRELWQSVTDRVPVLGDTAALLVAGAVCAALAAVWLLVLSVTPTRRWWVMETGRSGVYAELDRRGTALLLRDSALAVPGVRTATVRVRRRGHRVRATAAFGELERVERQLNEALTATVEVLGLVRRPRLKVVLTPADHWVPPHRSPASRAPSPASSTDTTGPSDASGPSDATEPSDASDASATGPSDPSGRPTAPARRRRGAGPDGNDLLSEGN